MPVTSRLKCSYTLLRHLLSSRYKRRRRENRRNLLSCRTDRLFIKFPVIFYKFQLLVAIHFKMEQQESWSFNSSLLLWCRKMSSSPSHNTLENWSACVCVWITGLGRSSRPTSTKRAVPEHPFTLFFASLHWRETKQKSNTLYYQGLGRKIKATWPDRKKSIQPYIIL